MRHLLLIVLPRKAPEDLRAQYLGIAQAWQKQPSSVTRVKWDDEIERLPDEGAVWLFGEENRFRGEFQTALMQSGAMLSLAFVGQGQVVVSIRVAGGKGDCPAICRN